MSKAQEQFTKDDNAGTHIITPSKSTHAIFIGEDGFFRCMDSNRLVEDLVTESGERIMCGVYE